MQNTTFDLTNNGRDKSAVPAVSKAAKILDLVSSAEVSPGVSDIARGAGLSKSTAHGLISTLVHEGFLATGDHGRGYVLGPRIAELAGRASETTLMRLVPPVLRDLTAQTGESVLFGRLNGDRVVILDRQEGTRPLNLSAAVGSTVPLMAGCLGKAYLGLLSAGSQAAQLSQNSLRRFTERSITDPDRYVEAVSQAREVGYALDRGEYIPGVSAACAAFAWRGGTYFLWMVGVGAGYCDEDLEGIGRRLSDARWSILSNLEEAKPVDGSNGR